MKKLLSIIVFATMFALTSFSQYTLPLIPETKVVIFENTNLYSAPDFMSSAKVLQPNDFITIKLSENKEGYYFVESPKGSGYVSSVKVMLNLKFTMPGYKEAIELAQRQKAFVESADARKACVSQYGTPTKVSTFTADGYNSMTYVWYCVNNLYISIDFKEVNGIWVKESTHTSECIK